MRVDLLQSDRTWPLFTLRRTLSNLVFYFDVPGDETGTDGWVDATRRDVQQCFAAAIDADVMEHNTLTARRTDALTLVSILNSNPGLTAKDSGANAQSSIRKLVEFCDQLETLERTASDEAERKADPEPVKPTATEGAKPKRPRRRRKSDATPPPLTAKQSEAVHIVGECEGNIKQAAERVGIDRKSMQERYEAAMKKLGKTAVTHGTKQLGNDKRGQANIVDGDDRRG